MSNEIKGVDRIVQEEIRKQVADRLVADAVAEMEATLRSKVESMLQELEVVSIYRMFDAMSNRDELRVILKLKESTNG